MTTETVVVVRIELLHVEPLIWRRVAVPITCTLETLHRTIQAVMGWLDKHLWDFAVDRDVYGMPRPDDAYWGHRVNDAAGITLADLIGREITSFDYTYDMGDDWEHRVIIEGVRPAEMGKTYPEFLGGERRCPPEDCGGVSGYYEFLNAITGPDKGKGSRRKREMLAWYGRGYDPDDIEPRKVKAALTQLVRSR
jgi:hypothetical protein